MTYENLTEANNLNNLLNLLLVTGYITYSHQEINPITKDVRKFFRIPNYEVLLDFKNIVSSVALNQIIVDLNEYHDFINSLAKGDKIGVEKFINSILPNASYYDLKTDKTYENPYHLYMLILLSSFLNKEYFNVLSNRESGMGRPDLIIKANDKSLGIIIEIKKTDDINKMEDISREGIEQIEKKDYINELEKKGYKNIQKYIIVFCGIK